MIITLILTEYPRKARISLLVFSFLLSSLFLHYSSLKNYFFNKQSAKLLFIVHVCQVFIATLLELGLVIINRVKLLGAAVSRTRFLSVTAGRTRAEFTESFHSISVNNKQHKRIGGSHKKEKEKKDCGRSEQHSFSLWTTNISKNKHEQGLQADTEFDPCTEIILGGFFFHLQSGLVSEALDYFYISFPSFFFFCFYLN